jgi:hypothetical protein
MLDRSQTTNLFSEQAQEADDLAGVAGVETEPVAGTGPAVDPAEAQRDASHSAAASPRARPFRSRPSGGVGAVDPKRRGAAGRPTLSFPVVRPRLDGRTRRLGLLAPAGLLLSILVIDPAGCGRQATHPDTPSSVRASMPPHKHAPVGRPHLKCAAPPRRGQRSRLNAPTPVSVLRAPASTAAQDSTPFAPAAAQVMPSAPVAPSARAVPAATSSLAAPNSGSPPPEGHGDEFGFER